MRIGIRAPLIRARLVSHEYDDTHGFQFEAHYF